MPTTPHHTRNGRPIPRLQIVGAVSASTRTALQRALAVRRAARAALVTGPAPLEDGATTLARTSAVIDDARWAMLGAEVERAITGVCDAVCRAALYEAGTNPQTECTDPAQRAAYGRWLVDTRDQLAGHVRDALVAEWPAYDSEHVLAQHPSAATAPV